MFLTAEEIRELTKRKHHRAQAEMLRAIGIEFRVRPDGSLVVSRAHVENQLGFRIEARAGKEPEVEPDWSAI